MKKLYTLVIIILSILLLSNCAESNSTAMHDISNELSQKPQTQESSVSILSMTDLEIIKKTADYLKSHDESLTFQETEITYLCNEIEGAVCKDSKGKDVLYKGDYLEIKYYPHPNAGDKDQSCCLIVYMGEGGKVLGYCKDKLSE